MQSSEWASERVEAKRQRLGQTAIAGNYYELGWRQN